MSLTSSFINHWHVTISRKRHSSEHFFHVGYNKNAKKMAVKDCLDQIVKSYRWNTNNNQTEDVPIIAALHGTDYHIAGELRN